MALQNNNLTVVQNFKANVIADNLSRGRWGNKFKKLFLKHRESIYTDYPAYNFKEGMKDCTKADGSTQERLDEAVDFRGTIVDGVFTVEAINTTKTDDGVTFYENDIRVESVTFSDESVTFSVDLKYWLEEVILEKNLFDFSNHSTWETVTLEVNATVLREYLDATIAELESYGTSHTRAKEDLELINHLGLCSTLASEIDRPHKVKSIYFRFRKKVKPPMIKEDGINKGYDPNYAWWEEKQFKEISKKVKNFKSFCTFVVGHDDGSTAGTYTESYVYVSGDIFSMGGVRVYWFVSAFLDIGIRSKKNLFSQILGIALLVVSIYLTAITGNPAWLKILLITVTLASFSGALSPKAQLLVSAVLLAYGVYNTDFGSMTAMELFNWSIENIDLFLNVITDYKSLSNEGGEYVEDSQEYEKQEKALRYIYTDVYDCYRVYDESISVSVEI